MMHRLIVLAVAAWPLAGNLAAQQASNASATRDSATARKIIGFRLADWKTAHFHDVNQADSAEQTLTKIGCEVNRSQHDGHIDLRFRSPTWKQITLETDEQVEQWSQWLVQQGMLTLIVDPSPDMKLSRVSYQLTAPRTLHVHNADEAEYTCQVLDMLGCQVRRTDHNGHMDLEITCPDWKTVGCPDCPTAHGWQDWLQQQGFTTRHQH